MVSCLWLARTMPFPPISGDRVYTGKLAMALAASGVQVTFAGFAGEAEPETIENMTWHVVPGAPRGQLAALLSTMPLVAARFATSSYRAEVTALAKRQAWDVVVIDQYGMGWAMAYRQLFSPTTPTFVFVTHDHEESVTLGQSRDPTIGLQKRAFLWQNHLKTKWSERATARASDLITTITEDDARVFARIAPQARILALTPGFDGPRLQDRRIDQSVARAAVMYGSFRWSAKQANLHQFLEQASRRIVDAGIEVRIVGDMADAFRADVQRRFPSVTFTGFVDDPAPYLDARLAIVAEPIGGGFKMKLLEYIFRRIPVLALESSIVGLPDAVRRHILVYPDLPALAAAVVSVIDDTDRLDRLQAAAFDAARSAFDWPDRGAALREAMIEGRPDPGAATSRDALSPQFSPYQAPPPPAAAPRTHHVPIREQT